LKSRPSLLIYCQLTHDDVTGWTDYVNMASHCSNLDVLSIVLIVNKRFLQAEEVFQFHNLTLCQRELSRLRRLGLLGLKIGSLAGTAAISLITGVYLTANGENYRSLHILVKLICISWSHAM